MPSDSTPLLRGRRPNYADNEGDGNYNQPGFGMRDESLWNFCWPPGPVGLSCLALLGLVFLSMLALSFSRLTPLEYGLVQNSITGKVDFDNVYTGGLYFLSPWRYFLRFPASVQLFEFSATRGAHAPPIDCRTGRDLADPDSGGQPIRLSVSLTYKLPQQNLGQLYRRYAMEYSARLEQFSWMVVSDVTQKYDPGQFWGNRTQITATMKEELREELLRRGPVFLTSFQLLKMEFLDRYEQGIVGIQLAIQNRTTFEYEQQVVRVVKQIDMMESTANAVIMGIDARAQAEAKLWRVNATCKGLNTTQAARAVGYSQLRQGIPTFSTNEALLKFIEIKAIAQHAPDALTVGLPSAAHSAP